MTLKVSVDLNGLTFGALYNFVDLARGAGTPDDELVPLVIDPLATEEVAIGMEVHLPDYAVRKAPDLSGLDLGQLIQAIDEIIDSEGDARGVIPELKELRDRLL